MITRYSCALNGVSLDTLDESIHITDVTEFPPQQRVVTAPRIGDGLHLLSRVRESLTVRVQFIVHAYDTLRRREVLQQVQQWAEPGGVLTIGDRPDQQLHVACTSTPTISALSWLDEMSIDFTAYAAPFWEAVTPVTATTSADDSMTLPGTADFAPVSVTVRNEGESPMTTLALPGTADFAPVSVTVRNEGESPMTTLALTVHQTSMVFPSLALEAGADLVLTVEHDRLRVTQGGTSLLLSRTPESADLLLAPCGKEFAVSVAADQPVSATFQARGRYL